MYRRLCLIALAVLWTNASHARVLKDLAELARDLIRYAKPVADCDSACINAALVNAGPNVGEVVVENSIKVRGRIAADEFKAYLANVAPAISESAPVAQLTVKKGNAAWLRHQVQLEGVLPSLGRINDVAEGIAKLQRTAFVAEMASGPAEGAVELGRSLIHQIGDLLIKYPKQENNFIALSALAQMLDGGHGEFTAYARQLIAFRMAMSEGHTLILGHLRELKTLFALKDPGPEGLLPRMARHAAEAKAATDAAALGEAFTALRRDNLLLVDFVKRADELKLTMASFGVDDDAVKQALRAFREVVQTVAKTEGLLTDLELLTTIQKNYLGLDGWRETLITVIKRNPDLADSPQFHLLEQFVDFKAFAESTLLR